ncbi:IS3 family transposase, partial [Mesorhizobium australicum]
YAQVITATGSDAVLMEGSAPPPVAQPAPQGVTKTIEALIAAG